MQSWPKLRLTSAATGWDPASQNLEYVFYGTHMLQSRCAGFFKVRVFSSIEAHLKGKLTWLLVR